MDDDIQTETMTDAPRESGDGVSEARIRQAFVSTLQGIYHPRVDYTPQIVKSS